MKWSHLKTLEPPAPAVTPSTPNPPPSAPAPGIEAPLATPEQVVAAKALGEQQQTVTEADKRLDEYDKRLKNLADDQEALRKRITELERKGNSPQVPSSVSEPQVPVTPPPALAPTVPPIAPDVVPRKGESGTAPGNPVQGMPPEAGEHAGKFLRKKQDETDSDFAKRFGLSPAMLSWWQANQAAEDRKLG